MIPVVLASQSPSRRQILRAGGIDPVIIVSEVDERALEVDFTGSVGELTTALSEAKARAVIDRIIASAPPTLDGADTVVVIAGDSLLEFDGQAIGKPGTAERTRAVWSAIAGQWTQLHSGHTVAVLTRAQQANGAVDRASDDGRGDDAGRTDSAPFELGALRSQRSATSVLIGSPTTEELEAYIATEEPFHVAGALTIDSYGGAFVDRLDGDHLTVLGLSLPVVRELVTDMGLFWPDLWALKR
ncbi:septum formation protein [Brevibacterium iodinum ATCC 49514]|uniref:Nucleoside triphosphate pyrophosphatase n=1 Tax=Brevibacterium iodinum ATCC 49514 TaxID=1255616 RepID=A0A2H1JNR6_9MICO|nr:Maf family protein [Brevibacterium iodinum]SMX89120.1 septum formation protein [Brevibacterium iodinum ATCC 49514]SUW12059.1 Septum formation protein Maf [Brevibacterium iodinum]